MGENGKQERQNQGREISSEEKPKRHRFSLAGELLKEQHCSEMLCLNPNERRQGTLEQKRTEKKSCCEALEE